MRLKMLIGMSGPAFTVDPGEITERFADKEASRLIKAGYAEKAPPVEKKKPETKQEWDDERDALIAENEQLKAETAALVEREAGLLSRIESLAGFKDSVTAAMQVIDPPVVETTQQVNQGAEKR